LTAIASKIPLSWRRYDAAMTSRLQIQRLAEALDGLITALYDSTAEEEAGWLRPLAALRGDVYDLLHGTPTLNSTDFGDVCRETLSLFRQDGPDPMFAERCALQARSGSAESMASIWLTEVLTICEKNDQRLR
jgi:hypothetical protein